MQHAAHTHYKLGNLKGKYHLEDIHTNEGITVNKFSVE
jgi:hypothetical protein